MDTNETPIGRIIRDVRHQRGLKLAGVSRQIPVSTLNAIELGRMVPSLPLADMIAEGLGLQPGTLDLPLLASVRDFGTRSSMVDRLLKRSVSLLEIQHTLRTVAHDPSMPRTHQQHAQVLIAQLLTHRGGWHRAAVLLTALIHGAPPLRGALQVEAYSLLGKCYLQLSQPEEALGHLLRATEGQSHTAAWESAMCNLGLVWSKMGQYRMAESQWRRAVNEVQDPVFLANAYFGLGLLAFRAGDFEGAVTAYHETLNLYCVAKVSATMQLQVLNNLLACHMQRRQWSVAESLIPEAPDMATVDPVPRGEWLTTRAELAWTQGHRDRAALLIEQAKASLGSSPVMSWFTARLLELTMGKAPEDARALITEIEDQLPRIRDPELMHAMHVMLAQQSLNAGFLDEVSGHLSALRAMFPII